MPEGPVPGGLSRDVAHLAPLPSPPPSGASANRAARGAARLRGASPSTGRAPLHHAAPPLEEARRRRLHDLDKPIAALFRDGNFKQRHRLGLPLA